LLVLLPSVLGLIAALANYNEVFGEEHTKTQIPLSRIRGN